MKDLSKKSGEELKKQLQTSEDTIAVNQKIIDDHKELAGYSAEELKQKSESLQLDIDRSDTLSETDKQELQMLSNKTMTGVLEEDELKRYTELNKKQQEINAKQTELTVEKQKTDTVQGAITAKTQAENTQKKVTVAMEKATFKERIKNFGLAVGTALTNFATMALAGLAVAAVTSIAGGIVGSITGAISGQTKANKISDNQDKIYSNKENKSKAEDLLEQYTEIQERKAKGLETSEDVDSLEEIISQLEELGVQIKGNGDVASATRDYIKQIESDNKKAIEWNYKNINKAAGKLEESQVSLAMESQFEQMMKDDSNYTNLSDKAKSKAMSTLNSLNSGIT